MNPIKEAARATAASGVVGSRQLVLVQTIDIARLTTHAVPVIPGGFVAIGGRGPKTDSNESGKTSFLAAVSLLLGDSEWRTRGQGGAGAAAMLFEPETAGVSAQSYVPARHGYVIGVFAQPERPVDSSLTVWLRIAASSPHLLFRWREGLVLPEQPRQRSSVDSLWESLGSAREAGANSYVEKLYGDVPRCLAYVSRRGRVKSQPSLLQMNAGAFNPEQIAEDLIALTGRSGIHLGETETRQRLHQHRKDLESRKQEHERACRDEDDQLAKVRARLRARGFVEKGKELWRLHFAAGLLEAEDDRLDLEAQRANHQEIVGRQDVVVEEIRAELAKLTDTDQIQAAVDEATRRYSEAEAEHRAASEREAGAKARRDLYGSQRLELQSRAEGWSGQTAEEAATERDAVSVSLPPLRQEVAVQEVASQAAERQLADVTAAGSRLAADVLARLQAENIDAAGLLNAVELEFGARQQWEPRLVLFADAVAVAENDGPAALGLISDIPGAVLVAKDRDGPLPPGVQRAPAGASGLLWALSEGTDISQRSAVHVGIGVHVVGGFADPVVGFATRVAAARQRVRDADEKKRDAANRLRTAGLRLQQADAALAKATAAAAVARIDRHIRDEERLAADAGAEASRLVGPKDRAHSALVDATARLRGREVEIGRLQVAIREADVACTDARNEVSRLDNELARNRVRLDRWARSWPGGVELARAVLGDGRRDSRTFGNDASLQLNYGLMEVGIRPDSDEAPDDPKLAEAVRNRRAVTGGDDRERAQFPEVLEPFEEWLDEHAERDQMLEERVRNARAQREAEIAVVDETVHGIWQELTGIQDAIQERIEQSLSEVSREYDRLDRESNGSGARIDVDCQRPVLPDDTWRWSAVPKWRRSTHGTMLAYDHQTNTAQEKQHTVHLVLAALLASPNAEGRALLLDELGDSLGVQHRREILESIAACAKARGFTVLATCQDAVLPDAMRFCDEVLYFEYVSRGDALNRPTRAFGFDANRERVELTADDILRDRPPA